MKKLVSIFMMVTMLFSLAACSSNTNIEESSYPAAQDGETSSSQTGGSYNSSVTPESSALELETTEDGSDSLVVYFSWSGNTENVAKSIQNQTNSDIFEITPVTPYSDDYDTVVDLAQEEQKEDARPTIAGNIENIADYDVIYVGFPKMEQGYICV